MVARVAHVITTLDVGGAEILLARHLAHLDRDRWSPTVVCLGRRGPVADDIEATGTPVRCLGLRPSAAAVAGIRHVRTSLRDARPDVVQTWMYHADLLGGLAARSLGVRAVAWGVHQTDLRPGGIRRSTRAVARLNARLAGTVPRVIVCSSESSRRAHRALGYPDDKVVVIRNGFPVADPPPAAGERLRAELGVRAGTPLVGRIGRDHPQKDHPSFLRAAAEVAASRPDVHFVMAGDGLTPGTGAVASLVDALGLAGRVHLLGLRRDVDVVHAALDVAVSSSSFGETFPLVIGEAMAAGVPVVTTDVGDCAELVGDTGLTVRPEDPGALAAAVLELLSEPVDVRRVRGARARQRVSECFDVATMTRRYEDLHAALLDASR